jgi:PKD repeat protein
MKKIILIALLFCIQQVQAQTCQASFTYTTGSNGDATFTSTSTDTTTNTKYSWQFSDFTGDNGNTGSYIHSFYYNGTYSVTLSIGDAATGCSSTVTNTVAITTAQPCNLKASYTYSVSQGTDGSDVLYTVTSTGLGGVCMTSIAAHVSPINPLVKDSGFIIGNAAGFGFSYLYDGSFITTLTVNGGGGCISIYSDTITISNQLTCNLITNYTDTLGNNGEASFYSTSSGVLSNMKSTWHFGDGTLSVIGNTTIHNYAFNGTYHVALVVSDSLNICKDSINKTIIISNAPNTCTSTPSFTLSPNASQAHALFALPAYSSQVINAVWTWGDGASSTGLYPSHTYASAGTYNICVKVYLACGDSATYCQVDTLSKISSTNQIVQISVVSGIAGINQVKTSNELRVYPNPNNGNFTIEVPGLEKGLAQLYDINGKLILSQPLNGKAYIDASDLNEGIYNIVVTSNEGILNKRVVIIK